MRTLDLENLRPYPPACPSDLALDRLAAEEITGAPLAALQAHVSGCAGCTARLKERHFDHLEHADERAMLAAIRRGLDRPQGLRSPVGRLWAWLRRARLPLVVAAGLAAALVLVRPVPAPDTVRMKGGLTLHVFRLLGSGSEEVPSGGPFAPGDTLRFVVDLPSEGYVNILGVQQDGALYTAWPRGKHQGAAQRPAGSGQQLPGAVSLDDAPGQETLFLVHCPKDAGLPQCQPGTGRPVCQQRCALRPFLLQKVR